MLGPTRHDLRPDVRAIAEDVCRRFGGTFNTYSGHGEPSGHHHSQVVDIWWKKGRGDPLPEAVGDAMVAWILGQYAGRGLRMVIWHSWWWRPEARWKPYPGLHGNHGPGADAHIHFVFD